MGNITEIAKALGVNRKTVHEWIKKDDDLATSLEQQKEANIDWAESQLRKLIEGVVLPDDKVFCKDGEITVHEGKKHLPPDNTSIIFFLKTQGKSRGYIERTEFAIPENVVPFSGIAVIDPTKDNGKGKKSDIHS